MAKLGARKGNQSNGLVCGPDCTCLLCQIAAPLEAGVSSPSLDALLPDGCSRTEPARSGSGGRIQTVRDKMPKAVADPMHVLNTELRRNDHIRSRRVVQRRRTRKEPP